MAYIISSGDISSGIILENNSMTVLKGGTATTTTINFNGNLYVSKGGTANNTRINSGGSMFVFNSGTANNVSLDPNGWLVFSGGGTAVLVGTPGGWVAVMTGSANIVYQYDPGVYLISFPRKGEQAVTRTADVVNSANATSESIVVCSGGTANDTTVGEQGMISVHSGGTANNTFLDGKASHSDYRGRIMIYNGGVANNTLVAGVCEVMSGGTANSAMVNSGASMIVSSGGTATIVFNPWQGIVSSKAGATITYLEREASVYYGGKSNGIISKTDALDSFVVESGFSAIVYSGGQTNNTTVNSSGCLYVSSGGTADNATVSSGGNLRIFSGGTMTGQMVFENGAVVSVYEGGILDFDLTRTSMDAAALLNDLSVIVGDPVFTLTVYGTEADGVYSLADGAAEFTGTISVVNTAGDELGTLTVGEKVMIDNLDYTLNLNESTLSVEVVSSVVPVPDYTFFSGDFNGDLFDTLAVQEGNTVTIYRNGEPWGLGLTLDPGWAIAGVGDFNGDGRDDFLRVNTEGYVVGEMSSGDGTFSPQVLNFLNKGWDTLGVGDFNGNGTDDVLIANPTGASETVGLLGYWESGVTWTLINGYSPEWECVSTGDFNGDGKCDMLWRNQFEGDGGLTYNAYCTWVVDDPVDWRMVSVANPAEWNFLCSGDFDGDKMNDIAMINDVGVVGIWGVNDGYLSSWSILSAVTSEWQLAGVGDFNGDGTDDITWANTDTGLVGCWQIENKELAGWQTLANIG